MDLISEPISRLFDVVIHVIQTASEFKPQLTQLQDTLGRIRQIIDEIQKQDRKLGGTLFEQDKFIKEIEDATKLVQECLKVKWNPFSRSNHSKKLKDQSQKLLNFFQIEVQAVQCRDIKEIRAEMNNVSEVVTRFTSDFRHLGQASGSGTIERKNLGWLVPALPTGVVGFDGQLTKLKAKILSDVYIHDGCGVGKAVDVTGVGGCGKTTLVKMLCNDPQIQGN
ncbi:putative powdery mildew resistance protein, RPW8 [Helianthus annuus]|nr:putative powdery mildew resistance protein, RPW8 [Helianthus annuus]